MGLIICQIHGDSGVSLVCPHIKKDVELRKKIGDLYDLRINMGDSGDVISHFFCPKCVDDFGLPQACETLPESAYYEFETVLDTIEPVCGNCLAEAKIP